MASSWKQAVTTVAVATAQGGNGGASAGPSRPQYKSPKTHIEEITQQLLIQKKANEDQR